mgnify:CR=1 FL=1
MTIIVRAPKALNKYQNHDTNSLNLLTDVAQDQLTVRLSLPFLSSLPQRVRTSLETPTW